MKCIGGVTKTIHATPKGLDCSEVVHTLETSLKLGD